MTLTLLLLALAALMVCAIPQGHGSTSSQGTQRTLLLVLGAGLAVAASVSWPLGLLLYVLILNVLRSPQPLLTLPNVYPLLVLVGAGMALRSTPDLVFITLAGLIAMGLVLGLWTLVTILHRWKPYTWGPFSETAGEFRLVGGQENPNNLQALSSVCSVAVVASALIAGPKMLLALPLVALPVLAVQWRQRGERAATLGLWVWAVTALCALPLFVSTWTWLLWVPMVGACCWAMPKALSRDTWWDSGRVRAWYLMLVAGWWIYGWSVRLFGQGWGQWPRYHEQLCALAQGLKTKDGKQPIQGAYLLSAAHNEYVQMLFEHGAIGLAALLTYLGVTGWRLAHGTVEQQAVLLVGLSLCAVATVLHPWTWYHQALVKNEQGARFWSMGSPGLVYASWLMAVCAEL